MGVPGFFRYIVKKYKSNYIKDAKPRVVNRLFFDFNGLLHPMCFKVLDTARPDETIDSLEDRMITEGILPYLVKLIETAQPQDLVYIAIDGVAPMAKCNQQRSRRWKSSIDAAETKAIAAKWDEPATKPDWTNAAISPGTKFMEKITQAVTQFCKSKEVTWKQQFGFSLIFDTAKTPGEGEHKIVKYIRNGENQQGTTSVIYGLDADLIFLSMGLEMKGIHLMRESSEFDKRKTTIPFKYVDIDIFKKSVTKSLDITIWDFIIVCTLIGNDFIPPIPSINVYDDGLDVLFSLYTNIYESLGERLTAGKCLNPVFMQRLFYGLGRLEHQFFVEYRTSNAHRKHKKPPNISGMKLELWQRENLIGPYKPRDEYCLGLDTSDEYKSRWYHGNNADQIESQCYKYIEGIQWTLQYYYDSTTDWAWTYPYTHAPFASDLANIQYTQRVVSFPRRRTQPLKSSWQLLLIMPPVYNWLIPKAYRERGDEVALYPTGPIHIDYSMKNLQWQGKPVLPPIPESYYDKMTQIDKAIPPRDMMIERCNNKPRPAIVLF